MQTIKVKQDQTDLRLDIFLKNALQISRTAAKKIVDEGLVKINNTLAKPHTKTSEGDVIKIKEAAKKVVKKIDEPEVKHAPPPPLDILYEDDNVVVINKQPGVLVHPAPGPATPLLTDALLKQYPEIKFVGDDPVRPGIVHRLDKNVSGVMIVAKTQEAFKLLKKQFQNRTAKKEYFALVHGNLPRESDTIKLRIARSRDKARMVARPESQEGKEAVTHYEVIERFKNYDFVRVKIETGRTHQIRAHFHALDHPIAGDPLYNIKHYRRMELDRIFLHATKLTIKLPSGEKKTFEAPLPDELETIIKKLPKT